MKPETKFRKHLVIPFLRTLKNTHIEAIQQLSIHGTPDYLLCVNGHFVALELKDGDKEPAGVQAYKLFEIERCGGTSLVARPDNWVELKKQLSKMDRGKKWK